MRSNFQGYFHAELARIQAEFPDPTENPDAFKILFPAHFLEPKLVPEGILEILEFFSCENLKRGIFLFNLELIGVEFLINFCGFGILKNAFKIFSG